MDAFDYFREQRFKKLKRNHPSLSEDIVEKVIVREWGLLSPKLKSQFNIIMEIANEHQSEKPEPTQRTQPVSASNKVNFEYAGQSYQASPFFVYFNNRRISIADKSPEFQDYVNKIREEYFHDYKPDPPKIKVNDRSVAKSINKKSQYQYDYETEDDEKYYRKQNTQQTQHAWIRIDFDFDEKDGTLNSSSGLCYMRYAAKKFFISPEKVYIIDKNRYREVDTTNYKSQFFDKIANLRLKYFQEGTQEPPIKNSLLKPSPSVKLPSQKNSIKKSRIIQSDDSLSSSDDDSLSVSQARITTADEPQKLEKSPPKEQPQDEIERLMLLRKLEEVQKRKETVINVEEEPVNIVKEQHSLNNSRMLNRAFMVKTEATFERQGAVESQDSKRRVRDAQPVEKPSKKLSDKETTKPHYHFVMKFPKGESEFRKYYNLAKDNLERMWPTSTFEQENGGDSFEIVLSVKDMKHKIWRGSVSSRNVDEVIAAVESLRL